MGLPSEVLDDVANVVGAAVTPLVASPEASTRAPSGSG